MRRSSSTRVLPTVFVLFFALLCWLPSFGHSVRSDGLRLVSTTTLEGRLAVFDDVWETIEERYYDPHFRGVDWQGRRTPFREAARKAQDSEQLYEVLRQMLAPLKDAHTRVYSPSNKFDWWSPRFATVGVTIREVAGQPTVINVESKSEAARSGIKPGDELVSIDSIPVETLLQTRLKDYGPAANESIRYRAIAALLDGPVDSLVQLRWRTRNDQIKTARLQRYWTQRELGFSGFRKNGIAVIKLDTFTQPVALEFARALPKIIGDARGLILDLRTNGGGDAEAMNDLASLFLPDGISLGIFADRSGASFELNTLIRRTQVDASTKRLGLPMAVLIGESTSSAAEIMASTFQTKGRALVIGSNSCGCVLAIRSRHNLPDGGILDVSEFDFRTAAGLRLEGAGVKPDVPATISRGDIYSHRDVALEIATAFLNKRSNATAAVVSGGPR
jgi:carboxyl-terminal processing protease